MNRWVVFSVFSVLLLSLTAGVISSSARQSESVPEPNIRAMYVNAVNIHFDEINSLYKYRNVPNPVQGIEQQIRLIPGSKLLFYVFMDEKLNIWLAGDKGLVTYTDIEINPAELDQLIQLYRSNFNKKSGVRSAEALRTLSRAHLESEPALDFEKLHKRISNVLLPQKIVENLGSTDLVIIVPTRGIGSVPFYSLQYNDPDSRFIDYHTFLFAPHLFAIQPELRIGNKVVIVGNPEYPDHEEFVFTDLPGAKKESVSVSAFFQNPYLLEGNEATKTKLTGLMNQAGLLHLATHGIASHENALDDSFLIFAGDPENPEGILTAREIQHSVIPAQLVVLSACQTGLGVSLDGGLVGLARAFLKAGSRNVVMSLWDVDDAVTADLMQLFYAEIFNPSRTDIRYFWQLYAHALREAKIKIKQNHPEAFYWASFSLFSSPFAAN